jgi:hypothetical protein
MHTAQQVAQRFGIRSRAALASDVRFAAPLFVRGHRFNVGPSSAGLLRPELSLPVYAGRYPRDGVAPVFNFFDRVGGGRRYQARVTREAALDWRGGRLSYDDHDGTDFVCPPGTPLPCAAPGVLVAVRDSWLRGGLTACVDHGGGLVTHYTHLTRVVAEVGEPLARGEVVGLSGVSGIDMMLFCPWVPPHVHFMVWVAGRPVDPFRAPLEPQAPGRWENGNEPRPASGPLLRDPAPLELRGVVVDRAAIERAVRACGDERIRRELEGAPGDEARAAILEDSLHHERWAWGDRMRATRVRPEGDAGHVRLTLPLPHDLYETARAADRWWTRPRESG